MSPASKWTTKLIGLRWRECSICELFLSGSMMDAMIARLRNKSFSHRCMSWVFMFLRRRVIRRPSLLKKQRGERSRHIAPICKQLAAQAFDQICNRLAVITVAWRQTTSQQLALVVDGQVQLEAVTLTH